jgi:hypothetical protein
MLVRCGPAVAAALALGLVVALAAGAGAPAAFGDPAGDGSGAADITAVTVSDDPVSGIVQFTLTANGETTIDAVLNPEVNVFVDTDRNPATGMPTGKEYDGSLPGGDYRLSYEREPEGAAIGDFEAWTGTKWEVVPESATMSFGRNGDTFTWRLSGADLGARGGGFDLYLASEIFNADTTTRAHDLAPDAGRWSYELSTATTTTTIGTTTQAAVRPLIGAPTATPRKAVAGQRFTVVFPVTRSDTGLPLASGTMVCDPSVLGRVIPHAESFKDGSARLTFTIPRSAKGRQLRVKVTITYAGASATRTAAFRVG